MRSRVPDNATNDPVMRAFFDRLDKRVTPVTNLSGDASATASAPPAGTTVASDSIAAVATTASTDSTPFGYAQAQADAIPVAINAIEVRLAALVTAFNAILPALDVITQLRSDAAANAALLDTHTTKINELLAGLRTAGRMES